jgi:hypothetical protein
VEFNTRQSKIQPVIAMTQISLAGTSAGAGSSGMRIKEP